LCPQGDINERTWGITLETLIERINIEMGYEAIVKK
jgi:hypothetical protein